MNRSNSHTHSDPAGEADFASIETPEELRSGATAEMPAGVLAPPLERERPARRPLVPKIVWTVAIGVAAAVTVLVLGMSLYSSSNLAVVTDVIGLPIGVARTNLIQQGFKVEVSDERFSSKPEGEVLSQSPRGGSKLKKGKTVFLIVSAGTEEFPMPDLVGNGLALAKGTLDARGLSMEIEEVVSTEPSGTVLATFPAAGAMVRSGDVVKVQVAVPKPASTGLEPFRMDGLAFVIDPAPVAAGKQDVPLEVARRLRALLEASGAAVTVLRTGVDSSTADVDRAAAAAQATATVGIGLSATESGPVGRIVTGPAASTDLRARLASRLSGVAPPASSATSTADAVLSSFRGPWVRIVLGSFVQRTDETSFSNPSWADEVARAIYGVLGEVYGRKEAL